MTTRKMTCCVCGSDAGRWKQHWNRDTGFGVCITCIKWLRGKGESETEIADLYGKEGVNWGEPKALREPAGDGAVCDSCGYIKTDKTFQRDRCPACNKNNIWNSRAT